MDTGTLKKHFATLIMGAFALAVGFFWFEAIKKILEPVSEHFGTDTWQGVTAIAVIVTFVAIFVTLIISWMFGRDKRRCEDKGWKWVDDECSRK